MRDMENAARVAMTMTKIMRAAMRAAMRKVTLWARTSLSMGDPVMTIALECKKGNLKAQV
jgi:hypothetical protein